MAAATLSQSAFRLNGAMLSDVGLVRAHNEDSCAFSTAQPSGEQAPDHLLLVADGMGGHAAGEVASRLAVDVVRRAYFASTAPVPEALARAFSLANQAIIEHAAAHPECAGMGTTCTTLAVRDGLAFLAHVGDSRVYLSRGTRLTQLSHDQTLVAKLVADGVLAPDEARDSPHRNVLLQALGTMEQIEPEIWNEGLPLAVGDILVMSSDGLHGLVDDADIAELAAALPPEEACRALISRACEAGGDDNISVGIFRVEPISASANADQRSTRPLSISAEVRRRLAGEITAGSRTAVATRRP